MKSLDFFGGRVFSTRDFLIAPRVFGNVAAADNAVAERDRSFTHHGDGGVAFNDGLAAVGDMIAADKDALGLVRCVIGLGHSGGDKSLASDLTLGTIKVTNDNTGYHSGVMAFRGYTDSKYKVAVDQVILGYNTSLQVHDDMKEDQLTINKVVVNSAVPHGKTSADYENNKEQFATQIEVWQNGVGTVGATMNIGELVVENDRIVALSNRTLTASEAYIKNTHLNIGKVTLNQGAKIRSGYSAGGANSIPETVNATGIAWAETNLSEIEALGDATIEIDNGTLDIEKISVASDKTLKIDTHQTSVTGESGYKTEALLGSKNGGVLFVHLNNNSTLDFNSKTVAESKMDIAAVANAPGKVLLGENASLNGESITVTGLDVGATGNLNEDLKVLAGVVEKDQKGLEGIKVTQQATDINCLSK